MGRLKSRCQTQVDLKREDNTVFIELKNKHNTCNSSPLTEVENKLKSVLDTNSGATAYWAYIIPGVKQKFGTELWRAGKGRNAEVRHGRLYKVWGSDVYKLVTGDGENLYRLYELLNTANLNISQTTQTLIEVSDEIVLAANPHLPAIKAKIYEEMLVGEPR
jgi:hypothetical protein